MVKKGKVEYVLIDVENDSYETFESMEDIEEYLDEEDYSEEDLEAVRVFAVETEFEVTLDSEYNFEEV